MRGNMRFLGRAVLLCALATPGVASATAESFVGPTALGGAAPISPMAPPSMAPPAMATVLREPRLVAGLRDTRMVDDFYRALGYRLAWQGTEGWSEAAHKLVRRLAAADTPGLDPAAIGGACVRERGCQIVRIAGGAVALKNKNRNHRTKRQ